MKYIGIIPARYASTRFPGKPLAMLGDKLVIRHVYEQACKALETVVVATDDERIYRAVEDFGGRVVMTRSDHRCGTDRCLEAYDILHREEDEDLNAEEQLARDKETVVINIQGDEPFIRPEQIEGIKDCFPTDIATLAQPYNSEEDTLADLENPNCVKVVFRHEDGRAILFSRSVIPYLRGIAPEQWIAQGCHYRHVGMYAYRADVLRRITQLPAGRLEQQESLEQLRWLEAGYTITVAETKSRSIGIDTPEDLEAARQLIETSTDR